MNKEWDESTLSSLRIHELRDLARKIGVKCPTALKKEELISQSMQILNGETEPYKAKDKKGRPNKSDSQMNALMEFFMPESVDFNSDINYVDDQFSFAVEMPPVEYNATDNELVEGLVEITANGVGILRVNGFETSPEDVFVHEMFLKGSKIKSGDYVKAYAKTIVMGRPRAVTKVISVNETLLEMPKQNTVSVSNLNLTCGASALILSNNINSAEFVDSIKNLNNTINFYVSAYEKQEYKNTKNTTFACVNPYQGFKDMYCCFNMAFNRANVLSQGASVVLVVNRVSAWFRALEGVMCDKIDNPIKLTAVVKEEILKTLQSAKKNGVTVVLLDSLNIEPHIKTFFTYELSQVVDLCKVDSDRA